MKTPNDMMPGTILPTKKWGDVKIIEYKSSKEIVVKFIDTSYQRTTRAEFIRSGALVDPTRPSLFGVGFMGIGPHSYADNYREYEIWRQMLKRCYCPVWKSKNPTYAEVTCNPQWHNFQEFAEWCQWQKGFEENGWHLDKDCLSFGESKEYGPESCAFIPVSLNSFETFRSKDGDLPRGVTFAKGAYRVNCKDKYGNSLHRRFRTIEEAEQLYTENRKEILKNILEANYHNLECRVVLAVCRKYCIELESENV